MKSEKGITLISLTVYIIVMTIVVGVVAMITTFFYKNTKGIREVDSITEYTTFNSYFSEEINHSNLKVSVCDSDGNYIVFNNGVQYTFIPENKGIYRNKVKICRNIDNCKFSEEIKNGKSVITVILKAGNQEKETTYILKD